MGTTARADHYRDRLAFCLITKRACFNHYVIEPGCPACARTTEARKIERQRQRKNLGARNRYKALRSLGLTKTRYGWE